MKGAALQTPRPNAGEGEGAPGARAVCVEDHGEADVEVHGGAGMCLWPMEYCSLEQMDAQGSPLESCLEQSLWPHGERSPCWSRLAGSTCDPSGDLFWSSLFLVTASCWRGSWGAACEELQAGTHMEECYEERVKTTLCRTWYRSEGRFIFSDVPQ